MDEKTTENIENVHLDTFVDVKCYLFHICNLI